MKLDAWQEEALKYRGDLILCTGRQIGKTTIMAIKAGERMLEKKTDIIIVSLTEDQAKLIINMILSYIEKKDKSAICKGPKKPTQNKISLKNKSMALARPVGNTGDAIRGFTGDVLIIDEASRFPELAFISGEPTLLSTGGEVWMCSTPFGKKGYFWEQYNATMHEDDTDKENEMGWKVIHVDGERAIHERLICNSWPEDKRAKSINRLNRLKQRWSKLRYGQEILALFLDDLMRFFDDDLIRKSCILKRGQADGYKTYIGSDLARLGGDQIAHQIVKTDSSNIVKHAESLVYVRQLTTVTERQIIELCKVWKADKVGIDAEAGTLGVSILDHLRETEIKNKVVPMNNRKILVEEKGEKEIYQRMQKEDFYDNLKSMMEHGEALLLDDEAVITSLRSVQMEIILQQDNPVGIRVFSNPHSESHIIEALVRAFYLAKKEKSLRLWCR